MGKFVVFIAGPTASGKSDAAIALARDIGGEIINADAIQIYQDLDILSARPSQADMEAVPHHLYGVKDGAQRCSAGIWAQLAVPVIDEVFARSRVPILVGGTGLYFQALAQGLSPIPDIDPKYRAQAIARHQELGADAFRQEVLANAPTLDWIVASDTQRLTRAWEVFAATQKPLSYFQDLPRKPLIDCGIARAVLSPPRDHLYARCDQRAELMMETSAIDEVRALAARGLDENLPVMKALGVPEIRAMLSGEWDEAHTLKMLQQHTRNFAKRQCTWFRGQAKDWPQYQTADELLGALIKASQDLRAR